MTIWLAEHVRDRLITEGRSLHPLETGGVLLGWRDGSDRIVMEVIGPGPLALHGRHMFLPDHAWQVQQIRAAFARTNGDLDYLGDWHTHPSGRAAMSGQDRKTLSRLDRRVSGALMLIAGGADDQWEFGGWTQYRSGFLRSGYAEPCNVRLFQAPGSWPRLSR